MATRANGVTAWDVEGREVLVFPVLNGLRHDYRWAAAWAKVG
jgi:hypothetical protein